jgi:flagellar biosynthesis/type III secretory pathway protein FliH
LILRNVVVSRERYRIGATPRTVVPVVTATPTPPPPLPAPLTIAAVLEWLATANEATRGACAAQLAPELETLRARARAEGYADGAGAATREFESRQATTLARLGALASQLETANNRAIADLTHSCAAIVIEAFVKLAGDALVTEAAAIGAVREVLERACASRRYTVFVHPVDLPAVEAAREGLQAVVNGATLEFQAQADLRLGGCRVESDFGLVDASFDGQLRALFATLRAAHERPEALR